MTSYYKETCIGGCREGGRGYHLRKWESLNVMLKRDKCYIANHHWRNHELYALAHRRMKVKGGNMKFENYLSSRLPITTSNFNDIKAGWFLLPIETRHFLPFQHACIRPCLAKKCLVGILIAYISHVLFQNSTAVCLLVAKKLPNVHQFHNLKPPMIFENRKKNGMHMKCWFVKEHVLKCRPNRSINKRVIATQTFRRKTQNLPHFWPPVPPILDF